MIKNILLTISGFLNLSIFAYAVYLSFSGAKTPDISRETFLNLSLITLQAILAALAILIAIVAVIGYNSIKRAAEETAKETAEKTAKQEAKKTAEEIAEAVVAKAVKSYFDTQKQEVSKNKPKKTSYSPKKYEREGKEA